MYPKISSPPPLGKEGEEAPTMHLLQQLTCRNLRNIYITGIAVEAHLHAFHGSKTILVLLPADGATS